MPAPRRTGSAAQSRPSRRARQARAAVLRQTAAAVFGLRRPSLVPIPSADRRRVLDPALVPELVQAAGDAELGAGADVAVERFAVIADRLYDARHPVLGKAEL